jgi:phage baseplate assembly protein gpV
MCLSLLVSWRLRKKRTGVKLSRLFLAPLAAAAVVLATASTAGASGNNEHFTFEVTEIDCDFVVFTVVNTHDGAGTVSAFSLDDPSDSVLGEILDFDDGIEFTYPLDEDGLDVSIELDYGTAEQPDKVHDVLGIDLPDECVEETTPPTVEVTTTVAQSTTTKVAKKPELAATGSSSVAPLALAAGAAVLGGGACLMASRKGLRRG